MKHWTEKDFTDWMYGLKEADTHVAACPECGGEIERLRLERGRTISLPEVSHEFLAAQRRSIYQRLGRPIHNWHPMRWGISVAALAVVVLSVTLHTWKSEPAISDEQLFSDLATMEQSNEPKAIAPVHKFFEE